MVCVSKTLDGFQITLQVELKWLRLMVLLQNFCKSINGSQNVQILAHLWFFANFFIYCILFNSTVIYCSAPSSNWFEYIQHVYDSTQEQLCNLWLVLNAEEMKLWHRQRKFLWNNSYQIVGVNLSIFNLLTWWLVISGVRSIFCEKIEALPRIIIFLAGRLNL